MNNKRLNDLSIEALSIFGNDKQLTKSIEELSELITAISKFQNGLCHNLNVIEEIADVYIMLNQLRIIFNLGLNHGLVEDVIQKKLNKLESYIIQSKEIINR